MYVAMSVLILSKGDSRLQVKVTSENATNEEVPAVGCRVPGSQDCGCHGREPGEVVLEQRLRLGGCFNVWRKLTLPAASGSETVFRPEGARKLTPILRMGVANDKSSTLPRRKHPAQPAGVDPRHLNARVARATLPRQT